MTAAEVTRHTLARAVDTHGYTVARLNVRTYPTTHAGTGAAVDFEVTAFGYGTHRLSHNVDAAKRDLRETARMYSDGPQDAVTITWAHGAQERVYA